MKLTVLTDDGLKDGKLLAEHGLCFYIEADGKKILFDTGYSDVFIKNAVSLGINLLDLDYIVLSHGHYDHTWGLVHYMALRFSALRQNKKVKNPIIVTHPDTFLEKFDETEGETGCLISEQKLRKCFDLILTKTPFNITENLIFLGEIPRLNDFEAKESMDKVLKNGKYKDDYLIEDSALIYKSAEGIDIITGCSHSGICNIIEYAKKTGADTKINKVIGGLHLICTPEEKMKKIVDYLKSQDIKEILPCHCTDSNAREALERIL